MSINSFMIASDIPFISSFKESVTDGSHLTSSSKVIALTSASVRPFNRVEFALSLSLDPWHFGHV